MGSLHGVTASCGSGALLFFLFPLQGNIQSKRCIKSTAEADLSPAQSNFLPIQKEENPGLNLGYAKGLTGCSSPKSFYEKHKMQENRLPKAKSCILYIFFHVLSFNLMTQALPEKQAERGLKKADTSLATSLSSKPF